MEDDQLVINNRQGRGYNLRFILDSSLELSHGFDNHESDPKDQHPD
jgi:hypothetical protein